jgi:hypothetical protein
MKAERFEQVDKILQATLERDGLEREAFLDEACAGDTALRSKSGRFPHDCRAVINQQQRELAIARAQQIFMALPSGSPGFLNQWATDGGNRRMRFGARLVF